MLVASTLSGLPPSEAVLMAYHQACNIGQLKLDSSEAELSDGTSRPTPGSLLYEWGSPKRLTTIRLKYPRVTYIYIAEYEPKYAAQMTRVCEVYSNAITRDDAERGFLSAVRKPQPSWERFSPSYRRILEIDRPKEGFKKRLILLDAGWVIMETGLYKAPH